MNLRQLQYFIEVSELERDITAPDENDPLGQLVQFQELLASDRVLGAGDL